MPEHDVWDGFASLLAEIIEKHAEELEIDNLPDPPKMCISDGSKIIKNNID